MQGEKSNAKALDYYPSAKQIFRELSWQAGTKIQIPTKTKEIDFSIKELLTYQEKEEDYELNLYINTFVSEETPIEHTGQIQIIIKPLTSQRAEPQTEETQVEQ